MANVRDQRSIESARVIGRVGALAVALGIGVAVANNPATALAKGDGGGSASGSASSEHHHGGKSKTTHNAGAGRHVDKPRHSSSSTSSAAGTDDGSAAGSASPATSTVQPHPKEKTKRSAVSSSTTTTPASSQTAVRGSVTGATTMPDDDNPAAPLQDSAVLTLLGAARREVGHSAGTTVTAKSAKVSTNPADTSTGAESTKPATSAAVTAAATVTAAQTGTDTATSTSVLANSGQLAAEKKAKKIASTLVVGVMKVVLFIGFAIEGEYQFRSVGGLNLQNLKQLWNAVTEYTQQAAMEYQLLDAMNPKVLQMVMAPHTWMGETVDGTRILYDNPDTIYRMMAVNSTSTYVISGKFGSGEMPADTSFSVLTGLGGNTAAVLNAKDMQINADGSFTITVSSKPAAAGETNHLQIPTDATLIVARNTLSDWSTQEPMSLSIERVGGPKDSLFAQIGGFDIPKLGSAIAGNQFLTNLVSLIPPLPSVPPVLAGLETAIVMGLGLVMEPQYIGVATGNGTKAANTFTDPSSNATFLATQLQSAGYFQLKNDQALVLTINPGNAGYFVVPVTNDWTITTNYWDQQTTLNIAQSVANADGTYTLVVSVADPGVANWVSTGGLNQGTISIRFQDVDTSDPDGPTVSSQVVSLDDLSSVLPAGTTYLTAAERAAAIAARKSAYDNRFAPYPQS